MTFGMLLLTLSVVTHWMLGKMAQKEAEEAFIKNRDYIQTEEDFYNSLPRTFFYLILMKSVCVIMGVCGVLYDVIMHLKTLS